MTIPQSHPLAAYQAQRAEIDAAIRRVLDSGWYVHGAEGAAFQAEFAAYLGLPHVQGVANGTDALVLALKALGIGPGDVVASVAHTAVATVSAIEQVGAVPLLVDTDPHHAMCPYHLAQALAADHAGSIKAVVPVHLFGQMADMPHIVALAHAHGAAVVEDCAQAHGARLHGRMAGTWGEVAAFSFYPTKNLGALGDGGAVACADGELAGRLARLAQYGWVDRVAVEPRGQNSRLDEIQAAVLRVKLARLDADNARRAAIVDRYRHMLAAADLELPGQRPGAVSVHHQFVVASDRRDALAEHLRQAGVGCAVHYPLPVHLQPAFAGRVLVGPGGLAHTEAAARRILSLPLYPQLDDAQVERVAQAVIAGCRAA